MLAYENFNGLLQWDKRITFLQGAEKVCQQRSRIVQILHVPQRVRVGPSLAVALQDSPFEHPARRRSRHGG
jgi:hypothetical protein